MVMSCVFFAVRTEFLNIMKTSLGFKGLKTQVYIYICEENINMNLKEIWCDWIHRAQERN
jgi:hypothetical protein